MPMTNTTLYRISSAVFVLFAAGHTFGFLGFTPSSAAGLAVRDAMNNVHFTEDGSTFSYGGFYLGLGLSVTAFMLFESFLAWQLGAMVRTTPRAAASIAWALSLLQFVSFALSLRYFAAIPATFSLVLAICLAWAAWRSAATPQAASPKASS
jgi:hypothetical protein